MMKTLVLGFVLSTLVCYVGASLLNEMKRKCQPVRCGGFCRAVNKPDGCPACVCDPVCLFPMCSPNCRIDYSGTSSMCPACVCQDSGGEKYPRRSSLGPPVLKLPQRKPALNLTSSDCRNCDWRYFEHYKVKDCVPVFENFCSCPIRFECPEEFMPDKSVCYYNGKTIPPGARIDTPNACEHCRCAVSVAGSAEIECNYAECKSLPLEEGCHHVYSRSHCCPVSKKCVNQSDLNRESVCMLESKTYYYGEYMSPDSTPCITCFCSENYDGVHGRACKVQDCVLEKERQLLKKGCTPIYGETNCCPLEFYCYNTTAKVIAQVRKFAVSSDPKVRCRFGNESYNIGVVLKLNGYNDCVNCFCSTPPEFTCIHHNCPDLPEARNASCRSVRNEGECCPKYNCGETAAITEKSVASDAIEASTASTALLSSLNISSATLHISTSTTTPSTTFMSSTTAEANTTTTTTTTSSTTSTTPTTTATTASTTKSTTTPTIAATTLSTTTTTPLTSTLVLTLITMTVAPTVPPNTSTDANTTITSTAAKMTTLISSTYTTTPQSTPPTTISTSTMSSTKKVEPSTTVSTSSTLPPTTTIQSSSTTLTSVPPILVTSSTKTSRGTTSQSSSASTVDKSARINELGSVKGKEKKKLSKECHPVKCGFLCKEGVDKNNCPTCNCDPACLIPKCQPECHLDYTHVPCPRCSCGNAKG